MAPPTMYVCLLFYSAIVRDTQYDKSILLYADIRIYVCMFEKTLIQKEFKNKMDNVCILG